MVFGLIALLLVVLFTLNSIKLLVSTRYEINWIKKSKTSKIGLDKCGYNSPNFVILLPALREQSILKQTLDHFSGIDYPLDKVAICVITTEKENFQKNHSRKRLKELAERLPKNVEEVDLIKNGGGIFPLSHITELISLINNAPQSQRLRTMEDYYDQVHTTPQMAASEVNNQNSKLGKSVFHHIHYPEIEGTKASQLNYAIDNLSVYLGELVKEECRTYIGVYDFDCEPDVRILKYIAKEFVDSALPPDMFQQPALPIKNLSLYKGGIIGAVLKGFALRSLQRGLGIEIFKLHFLGWLKKEKIPKFLKAILRPMVYGVGAGMYVNLSSLRRIGLFPEPVDDLGVGYRMSFLNSEILPVPFISIMNPYYSVPQMMNSYSFVFMGGVQAYKDTRCVAQAIGAVSKAEQYLLLGRECLDSLGWLLGVPFFGAAFIVTAYSFGDFGVLFVIVSLFLRYPFMLFISKQTYNQLTVAYSGSMEPIKRLGMTAYILSVIHPIVAWFGPMWFLHLKLKSVIKNKKQIDFGKTER